MIRDGFADFRCIIADVLALTIFKTIATKLLVRCMRGTQCSFNGSLYLHDVSPVDIDGDESYDLCPGLPCKPCTHPSKVLQGGSKNKGHVIIS